MGKGYNNYMCKKPFHPGSKANIKRAWMAEQKTENEKRKQEELKVQYEKEQDLYNNRALLSTESKDKLELNFMYEAPPGAKRERQKEDDEPEFKFEWQRKYNAPREDYAKGNADIKDQPFGIPVRNVRCIKCHKWGHINTDKECPLFAQASTSSMPTTSMDPMELMRQMREDGYGLKENVLGHQLSRAANQQLIPSDESDPEMEFLKSLSASEKMKLLRKLKKLSKKQEKASKCKKKSKKSDHHSKRKNKKRNESSDDSESESSSENSSSDERKVKKHSKKSNNKSKKIRESPSETESESEKEHKKSKHLKNKESSYSKREKKHVCREAKESSTSKKTHSDSKGESLKHASKFTYKSKSCKSSDSSRKHVEHERKSKQDRSSKKNYASHSTSSSDSEKKDKPSKSKTKSDSKKKTSKDEENKNKLSDSDTNTDTDKNENSKPDTSPKISKDSCSEKHDRESGGQIDDRKWEEEKQPVLNEKIEDKESKSRRKEVERQTLESTDEVENKETNSKRKGGEELSAPKKRKEDIEAGPSNFQCNSPNHPDGFSHTCPQARIEMNYLQVKEEYIGKIHDKFRHFHRERRSPSVKQKYNK